MILVQALTTGAGVTTTTGSQAQLESDIVVGDVDTANALRGLKIVVDSKTTIDLSLAVFVNVLFKFMNRTAGSVVGLILKVATGRIMKTATYSFVNDGVTTPTIYANSTRGNGQPLEAIQDSINPTSNKTIGNFKGLFLTPVANISSFDMMYVDGTSQNLTVVEADALFASENDTEANGRLDQAVTGFDNRSGRIASVKVNTNAVGAVFYFTVN